MQYSLKEKINITEEFLEELISKSWQEADALQQQIANIDTSCKLGADVVKLLKNTCTSYYTLIGCLEALVDEPEAVELHTDTADKEDAVETKPELLDEFEPEDSGLGLPAEPQSVSAEVKQDFEPFEYFVDFDEPSGEPITDKDLYN